MITKPSWYNRRHFLTSLASGTAAAATGASLSFADSKGSSSPPVSLDPRDPVSYYWDRSLSELVDLGPYNASPEEMERHRIYANLVLALLHGYFNGNKEGELGEYPWQSSKRTHGSGTQSLYSGGRYLGHNICCIAVDSDGDIIDFDFNHNSIFNSSVEHAEARLIKRIFSLADIHEDWDSAVGTDNYWNLDEEAQKAPAKGDLDDNYGRSLANVTIYTSLESCAQCSGIMTLANIKQVVFLQPDPSQYQIGRIMYRLSRPIGQEDGLGAPRPISGTEIGMEVTQRLDKDYKTYYETVGREEGKIPFFKPPGSENDPAKWSVSKSITSFLCTDLAYDSYKSGRDTLETMSLSYSDYRPEGVNNLSNNDVLMQARRFLNYALTEGRRGTPHR